MNDVPFYRTKMGHRFYEHTVPELVRQLERLNELLAQISAGLERKGDDADA